MIGEETDEFKNTILMTGSFILFMIRNFNILMLFLIMYVHVCI